MKCLLFVPGSEIIEATRTYHDFYVLVGSGALKFSLHKGVGQL